MTESSSNAPPPSGQVLRVGLHPARPATPERGASLRADPGPPPEPLLALAGPAVILGGHDPFSGGLAPGAASLYGPRAAFLMSENGPLWVADTGHHRLLGWAQRPTADQTAADWVIGQPDFRTEGRNAGRDRAEATTLNMPTGIHRFGDGGMMLADSWNNRVLIWTEAPTESHARPDIILGQADGHGDRPNRGTDRPAADTMHWPFAALMAGGRLYVADAGNRRILGWQALPTETGQPADFVLGQPDLETRSDNAGGPADARTMRWPHDLTLVGSNLAVSDAGNNRVLLFEGAPKQDNPEAQIVVGQQDFSGVDHNQGEYLPTASALNMPYALEATGDTLFVADTANSRLVGYPLPLRNGQDAARLTAQDHFQAKGDNRWQLPTRDSLCWPYGLKVTGKTAIVSDTGNHRVLLWDLAEGAGAG